MPRAMSNVEFQSLAERARSMRGPTLHELHEHAAKELAQDALEGLYRGEDVDGVPFAPLKKSRKDGTTQPLLKTRTLANAIRDIRDGSFFESGNLRDAALSPFQSLRDVAPYAVFHQFGTRRMPRRRFFGPGKRFQRRLGRAFTDWIRTWVDSLKLTQAGR